MNNPVFNFQQLSPYKNFIIYYYNTRTPYRLFTPAYLRILLWLIGNIGLVAGLC